MARPHDRVWRAIDDGPAARLVPAKGLPLTVPERLRRIPLAAAAFAALLLAACSGGESAQPTPAPPTPAASATAVASPTPDPLASPEADGARALGHVRALTEIGPRVAGSENEQAARDYLADELERYGYDVTIQPFPFDGSKYRPARVDAGAEPFAAIAFHGVAAGDVTGTLIDAGIGRPEEFPAGGLQGAIALIERGDLTFEQKGANAVAAGAGAIIVYNNEDGNLIGDAASVPVPMVAVTRETGLRLKELIAAGGAQAKVAVVPPTGTAYNVIAKPKGAATCATVTGGHYDSVPVTEGADDNASGTAATVELARVVAANKLAGPHCFVLFGAEELGLIGSMYYVSQLTQADLDAMRAMVDLDVVGTTVPIALVGDADMVELVRVEAQRAGIEAAPGELPGNAGSDHISFQDAGVPVVFFYRHDPLIHTPADAIGRLDAASLEQTVLLAYATLAALAGG